MCLINLAILYCDNDEVAPKVFAKLFSKSGKKQIMYWVKLL